MTKNLRIAPNSKEAEVLILGYMLNRVDGINSCADALNGEDFYYVEHNVVFDVLKTFYLNDKPADVHLLAEELKRLGKLSYVGGVDYLSAIAQEAGGGVLIDEYIELVKHKSMLRRMISFYQDGVEAALQEPASVPEFIDEQQGKLFEIGQGASSELGCIYKDIVSGLKSEDGKSFEQKLNEKIEYYCKHGEPSRETTGLPTGFCDLDKIIGGMRDSNLIVFAGRPGTGKTAFALNVAEHVCFNLGLPVAIFSLEMSKEELSNRMISSQTEIDSQNIVDGNLEENEHRIVVEKIRKMKEKKLIILDKPNVSVSQIRTKARRLKEVHDIKLIVIDYLQIIKCSSKYNINRHLEIAEISIGLKNLARELKIPILCGSQLSRKIEERGPEAYPMLSDLRESGSIEQDADVVLMLKRIVCKDTKEGTSKEVDLEKTSWYVRKNRHGKIGDFNLLFKNKCTKFVNYSGCQDDEKKKDLDARWENIGC